MTSFLRKLSRWNFRRTADTGTLEGAIVLCNDLFRKDKPEWLTKLKIEKPKPKRARKGENEIKEQDEEEVAAAGQHEDEDTYGPSAGYAGPPEDEEPTLEDFRRQIDSVRRDRVAVEHQKRQLEKVAALLLDKECRLLEALESKRKKLENEKLLEMQRAVALARNLEKEQARLEAQNVDQAVEDINAQDLGLDEQHLQQQEQALSQQIEKEEAALRLRKQALLQLRQGRTPQAPTRATFLPGSQMNVASQLGRQFSLAAPLPAPPRIMRFGSSNDSLNDTQRRRQLALELAQSIRDRRSSFIAGASRKRQRTGLEGGGLAFPPGARLAGDLQDNASLAHILGESDADGKADLTSSMYLNY